jgi:DNA-binding FrmR family transcriptional regulator
VAGIPGPRARCVRKGLCPDEYCIDVLTQISAATKAPEAVSLGLLDEHLRHCVAEGGETADAKVREASEAVAHLVRS